MGDDALGENEIWPISERSMADRGFRYKLLMRKDGLVLRVTVSWCVCS